MNNEVIANRAIQMMGGKMGSKNLSIQMIMLTNHQSTNDVFPTAMHISIALKAKKKAFTLFEDFRKELAKICEFNKIVKWEELIFKMQLL